MTEETLKHKLYVIIFGTHTKAGKTFDLWLIIAIVVASLVLIIDSIQGLSPETHQILSYIEFGLTVLFTIEYILRLYCSPRPLAYATSFYGIIDLLSILPSYLALIFPMASYWGIIRALRIMRIFRVLKLMRYLQDSNMLLMSLKRSKQKILVFFSMVLILVTLFGALMFVIEGPENGFTSLPRSIYWAIVTITTVGYGDISPHTAFGQAIASMAMLLGYSILAIPTGIYSTELFNEITLHRTLVKCPNCQRSGHEADADYCKYCGSELPEAENRVTAGIDQKNN